MQEQDKDRDGDQVQMQDKDRDGDADDFQNLPEDLRRALHTSLRIALRGVIRDVKDPNLEYGLSEHGRPPKESLHDALVKAYLHQIRWASVEHSTV